MRKKIIILEYSFVFLLIYKKNIKKKNLIKYLGILTYELGWKSLEHCSKKIFYENTTKQKSSSLNLTSPN